MTDLTERWAWLPGYERLYLVSSEGVIRSYVTPNSRLPRSKYRVLHGAKNSRGYVMLAIKWGPIKYLSVHHIVAATFHGPRPEGQEVCHNNNIRDDNRAVNLRWDTHRENMQDRVRAGNYLVELQTHCKRGHEMTSGNVYAHKKGEKYVRNCRTCVRDSQRAVAEQKKREAKKAA